MSDSALLDTNFVIAVFAGEPSAVAQLEALNEVYLPLPVVGELIYGALYSARAEANLARAIEFSSACAILFPDEATASGYGRLCAALRRKGRRIPDNDAWIASLALQHGLALITRDGHFADVLGLTSKAW